MNIRSFIDLSNVKEDFSKLALPLKTNIFRKIGVSFIVLILIVASLIVDFSVINLVVCLLAYIGFWGFIGYTFTKFKEERYATVIGSCIDINKKTEKKLRSSAPGKSSVTLLCNENKVEVPVPFNQRIYRGTEVKVYFSEDGLYEVAPQCYRITNPIAIEITDTTHEDLKTEKSSN